MDRDRDRDRTDVRDTAAATPAADRSFIVEEGAGDRVIVERGRDAAGDATAPADQDILVRQDAAETMPSRALNDPREATADELTRFSTDTTGSAGTMNMAGRPLEPAPAAGVRGAGSDIFAWIREGMRVVDAGGEDLGKVDVVSMGDPEAVTTQGEDYAPRDDTILTDFGRALTGAEGEPDVPEPFRSRLVREGFVKVAGKGWFGKDRYLTADMIARVEGDTVVLTVSRDRIPTDQG